MVEVTDWTDIEEFDDDEFEATVMAAHRAGTLKLLRETAEALQRHFRNKGRHQLADILAGIRKNGKDYPC